MFFKCCQKIVIYLFHLFTPSILGIACQRHARVGLRPTHPPIIARFPPVKNFSYIPGHLQFINEHVVNDINYVSAKEGTVSLEFKTFTEILNITNNFRQYYYWNYNVRPIQNLLLLSKLLGTLFGKNKKKEYICLAATHNLLTIQKYIHLVCHDAFSQNPQKRCSRSLKKLFYMSTWPSFHCFRHFIPLVLKPSFSTKYKCSLILLFTLEEQKMYVYHCWF